MLIIFSAFFLLLADIFPPVFGSSSTHDDNLITALNPFHYYDFPPYYSSDEANKSLLAPSFDKNLYSPCELRDRTIICGFGLSFSEIKTVLDRNPGDYVKLHLYLNLKDPESENITLIDQLVNPDEITFNEITVQCENDELSLIISPQAFGHENSKNVQLSKLNIGNCDVVSLNGDFVKYIENKLTLTMNICKGMDNFMNRDPALIEHIHQLNIVGCNAISNFTSPCHCEHDKYSVSCSSNNNDMSLISEALKFKSNDLNIVSHYYFRTLQIILSESEIKNVAAHLVDFERTTFTEISVKCLGENSKVTIDRYAFQSNVSSNVTLIREKNSSFPSSFTITEQCNLSEMNWSFIEYLPKLRNIYLPTSHGIGNVGKDLESYIEKGINVYLNGSTLMLANLT